MSKGEVNSRFLELHESLCEEFREATTPKILQLLIITAIMTADLNMEQIEAKGESKDVLRKINEVFGSVLTYAMDNGADYRAMLHKTADEYGRITDETEGVGAMIEDALKDTVTQPREKKKDWVYIVQQKNPVWN